MTLHARAAASAILAAVAASGGGCTYAGSFDDPDPGGRLDAIRRALAADDRSAVPHLISLLDSDDAAVRLYAINALEQFTGQTLGYDHAAPARDRRLAVERWVAWYRRQQEAPEPAGRSPGTAAPASSGTPRQAAAYSG